MNEIKSFILGLSLSILCITLYSEYSYTEKKPSKPQQNIKLELFKQAKASTLPTIPLQKSIKKQTLSEYKISDTSLDNIEGVDDIEILNINTNDIIPIEHNNIINNNTSISHIENEEKVALLPNEISISDEEESPWVIAKGSKHIDNKKLLEKYNTSNNSITINTSLENKDNKEGLSVNVAERIKQSIIFPIPNEILSDENLTPTFINNTQPKKKSTPKQTTPKIVEKKQVDTNKTNILDNISSWLSPKTQTSEIPQKSKKVAAPIYSSQPVSNTQKNSNPKQSIGDFYEALQKTKNNTTRKRIVPTELKLSFNNDRAEISGKTLNWLKTFSETTIKENKILQIKLDSSTPLELQKKRLNLLYTIFTNNGVDINRIKTSFTPIEENTFIIRIKTATQTHKQEEL